MLEVGKCFRYIIKGHHSILDTVNILMKAENDLMQPDLRGCSRESHAVYFVSWSGVVTGD